jgi:hypothetical protein
MYSPEFEALQFVNSREWLLNISITNLENGGTHVLRYALLTRTAYMMRPVDLRYLTAHYGLPPLRPGPSILELVWTQRMGPSSSDLSTSFRIPFDYQPNAPLPQTLPLLGHGPGLNSVTPDLPTPSSRHSTVYRIGMSCYFAHGAKPCNITHFTKHAKLLLSSPRQSDESYACPQLMHLDEYALNDVTRLLARSLIVRYGEKSSVHSTGNIVSSPVSSAWTAGLSGDKPSTESCDDRSASTLEARVTSGAALRAKLIAESGFVTDERWMAYPKPIPPLPTRYELGALLTAEGKRVGIEIGVQHGFFTEVLLSTWLNAEVIFALDPWEAQENYIDTANVGYQEDIFKVTILASRAELAWKMLFSTVFPFFANLMSCLRRNDRVQAES